MKYTLILALSLSLIITPFCYSMEKEKPKTVDIPIEKLEKVLKINGLTDLNDFLEPSNSIKRNKVENLPALYTTTDILLQHQRDIADVLKTHNKAINQLSWQVYWCKVGVITCAAFAIGCQFFPLLTIRQSCNFSANFTISRDQGNTCSNPWFKS